MIALNRIISDNSTTVRSKIGLDQRSVRRRNGPARLPRIWGGCRRWPAAARAERAPDGNAMADEGRLDRLVTGLLTLVAAGYAVAVLIRIVAMYG